MRYSTIVLVKIDELEDAIRNSNVENKDKLKLYLREIRKLIVEEVRKEVGIWMKKTYFISQIKHILNYI